MVMQVSGGFVRLTTTIVHFSVAYTTRGLATTTISRAILAALRLDFVYENNRIGKHKAT